MSVVHANILSFNIYIELQYQIQSRLLEAALSYHRLDKQIIQNLSKQWPINSMILAGEYDDIDMITYTIPNQNIG